MPMKAVLFDLGLTLIHTASFPEIYKQILARFDVTVSLDSIVSAQKVIEGEVDTSIYDESRRKEFWINYNTSLLKKLGVKENTVFIASQIDELWWTYSHIQVYPDVEPTLTGLRAKGLKLGLVSNGFQQDLDHVLGELELKRWFDSVVCIDSCSCAKPDKQIFRYALEQLGIEPSEAVFVGDSIVQDYQGALAVGIKAYLIDRDGELPSKYNKIECLTDLLTLIE